MNATQIGAEGEEALFPSVLMALPTKGRRTMSVKDRILRSITLNDDGCWMWQKATQSRGYGCINIAGRTQLAHRVAYLEWKGEPPEGTQADHQCHNRDETCTGGVTCLHRKCVNPEHLEAVTARVNNRRGLSPAAINARRTECVNGHPLDEANTYMKAGKRQCRACHTAQDKRWRQAKRAEIKAAEAELAVAA